MKTSVTAYVTLVIPVEIEREFCGTASDAARKTAALARVADHPIVNLEMYVSSVDWEDEEAGHIADSMLGDLRLADRDSRLICQLSPEAVREFTSVMLNQLKMVRALSDAAEKERP